MERLIKQLATLACWEDTVRTTYTTPVCSLQQQNGLHRLSGNWILTSNLRQVYLIGATKFTSPTLAARESKNVTLAFAASLVQEEAPEVRIRAQQAIHIIRLRGAGNEHEPGNLSDRCYALTFLPINSFKVKKWLQRANHKRGKSNRDIILCAVWRSTSQKL